MSKSALSRPYLHDEKKPKGYGKLSQKEKFIAAAKAHGADESGETFLRSFKAIAKPKRR